MPPEQEQHVLAALVNLGWLENDHALHMEAVHAIRTILGCSTDEAKAVLGDLRTRKLIDVTSTPDNEFDSQEPTPQTRLRWTRPPAVH